jgi:hypothetical protein
VLAACAAIARQQEIGQLNRSNLFQEPAADSASGSSLTLDSSTAASSHLRHRAAGSSIIDAGTEAGSRIMIKLRRCIDRKDRQPDTH